MQINTTKTILWNEHHRSTLVENKGTSRIVRATTRKERTYTMRSQFRVRQHTIAVLSVLCCFVALLPQHAVSALRSKRRQTEQQVRNSDQNHELKACLENGSELLQALRDYFGDNKEKASSVGQTYGSPIGSWCVALNVEDKLRGDSQNRLREYVSTATQALVSAHDDDGAIADLDADGLMQGWISSASTKQCLDACGAIDPGIDSSYLSNEEDFESNAIEEEDEDQVLPGDNTSNANEGAAISIYNIQEIEWGKEEDQVLPEEKSSNSNEDAFNYVNSINNDSEGGEKQDQAIPIDTASNSNGETSNAGNFNQESEGGKEEDQSMPIGNELTSNKDTSNAGSSNHENTHTDSLPNGSRNKTTSGMLIRLIPVKLLALLSFMCLVLGLRQMFLSSDGDNCCSKLSASLGFRSGGHAAYQGIDPSDVLDHQKSVEFELLQLAASGDADVELDMNIDIEIS